MDEWGRFNKGIFSWMFSWFTSSSYQNEKSPHPISKWKSVMQDMRTQKRAVLQYGIAARSAA